jgi:hypothetical protein
MTRCAINRYGCACGVVVFCDSDATPSLYVSELMRVGFIIQANRQLMVQ